MDFVEAIKLYEQLRFVMVVLVSHVRVGFLSAEIIMSNTQFAYWNF